MQIFRPFDAYKKSWISKTLYVQILEFYFLNYSATILELTALLLHLISTFNFYILLTSYKRNFLNQKLEIMTKISYIKVSICCFIFSNVMFSFQLSQNNIVKYNVIEVDSNDIVVNTREIYLNEEREFSKKPAFLISMLVCHFFRDGYVLSLLLVLNVLIFIEGKKALYKKQQMNLRNKELSFSCDDSMYPTNSTNEIEKRVKKSTKKSYLKLTTMVLATSLNFIIGRIPILVGFILKAIDQEWSNRVNLAMKVGCTSVFVSYFLFFFLYYFFNNRFRKVFKQYF